MAAGSFGIGTGLIGVCYARIQDMPIFKAAIKRMMMLVTISVLGFFFKFIFHTWSVIFFAFCIFCYVAFLCNQILNSIFWKNSVDCNSTGEDELALLLFSNFLSLAPKYPFYFFIAELIFFLCQWIALFYLSLYL